MGFDLCSFAPPVAPEELWLRNGSSRDDSSNNAHGSNPQTFAKFSDAGSNYPKSGKNLRRSDSPSIRMLQAGPDTSGNGLLT